MPRDILSRLPTPRTLLSRLRGDWPAQVPLETKGPARLVRDAHGIVHVLAAHEEDLYRGFGFAVGWDRLLQLQLYRLFAQGRLAELLGEGSLGSILPALGRLPAVEADRFLRGLDLPREALLALGRLSHPARTLLEAYCQGVEAALELHRRLPDPEQALLPALGRFAPWEPLAIALFIGFANDAVCLHTDLLVDRTITRLGTRRAQDLWGDIPLVAALGDRPPSTPGPPGSDIPTAPQPDASAGGRPSWPALLRRLGVRPLGGGPGGSTAWAVAGAGTRSGRPLLASDPHVPLAPIPSFWYPVHLCGGEVDVAGGSLVGLPLLAMGHSRHLAWGNTSVMKHNVDLVRVHRHPHRPELYWRAGEWQPLERREVVVQVRGRPPQLLEIHQGPCGLVLPGTRAHDGCEFAAQVSLGDPAALVEGYLRFPRDRTLADREESLGLTSRGCLAWNQVTAATQGGIALHQTGVFPRRGDGHGALPHDGSSPAADLGPPLAFAELPRRVDPAVGLVVSTNQRLQLPDDERFLASLYEPPLRCGRIAELLRRDWGQLATHRACQVQLDVTELRAAEQIATLRRALQPHPPRDQEDAAARELLADWAAAPRCTPAAVGCSLYQAFRRELIRLLLEGPLGQPLADELALLSRHGLLLFERVLADPQDPWLGGCPTDRPDRRELLLAEAWWRALALLRRALGPDVRRWEWGRLNTLDLAHPFSRLPLVGPWLGLGRHPVGGSETTPCMATATWEEDGRHVGVGPTTRFVIDLATPDRALWSHSTGVSGQRLSPWRGNLTEDWLAGVYFELRLGPEVAAVETLVLGRHG